eukprot:GEMP01135746.1.p1 GENE.GEMP01135746.1~~GEMP01135746.1.p1  ORF type:complete len:160 (+),score=7.11 GEMP01135746.1:65-481(+)
MLPLVFLVLAISVGAVDFKYRDYAEITTFFQKLQQDHGDIVEVFDALQKWPDIAPDKTDLPRCGNSPCEWLVVHITNLTSYKQNPLTEHIFGNYKYPDTEPLRFSRFCIEQKKLSHVGRATPICGENGPGTSYIKVYI